jgi:hypothetical protein
MDSYASMTPTIALLLLKFTQGEGKRWQSIKNGTVVSPSKSPGDPLHVGRRGTNQLCLLERYLDVLVKHTNEISPPTALVEGTAPVCLSRRRIVKMIYFKL